MKIAQKECETLQYEITTGKTTTTTLITTPTESAVTPKGKATGGTTEVVEKLLKYNNNGAATTTMTDEHNNIVVTTTNSSSSSSSSSSSTTTSNTNTNNNSSSINKNVPITKTTTTTKSFGTHNKDSIIAEATKILLKNGLNGTTAAAAAAAATLLSAAATFQLPAPRPSSSTSSSSSSYLNPSPPPAHSGNTHKIGSSLAPAAASGAIDINAHSHHSHLSPQRKFLNNGTSSSPAAAPAPAAQSTVPAKSMAATATTTKPSAQMHLGMSAPATVPHSSAAGKSDLSGPIDYTFHAVNASPTFGGNHNHHKYPLVGGSSTSRSDLGRNPLSGCTSAGTGAGGRLQFFKDGKFILELARSKDGDGKGGWVSVPRKHFRTPSAATSSTVTPTLATTTAYPKNESSTSLSFSDDNSSIQSSPWQRDHCWKQSAPRRGISKELSLYFWRPRAVISLTTKGLQVANRKRRKPLDSPVKCEAVHFECLRTTSAKETPSACKETTEPDDKTITLSKKEPDQPMDDDDGVVAKESGPLNKSEATDKVESPSCPTPAIDNLESMDTSGGENMEAPSEVHNNSIATTTERSEQVSNVEKQAKPLNEMEHQEIVDKNDETKNPKVDEDIVEKMNTSEDGENTNALSDGVEDIPTSIIAVNGHDSGVVDAKNDKDSTEPDSCKTVQNKDTVNEHKDQTIESQGGDSTRLQSTESTEAVREGEPKTVPAKGNKPRAKLNTIIQKLIDSMPTRVVPLSKGASASSSANNNSSTTSNNNNANNKVSPTTASSASVVSSSARLVDYHQQHVSPRKRILRDLEKVSLEDNGTSVAGGKRSRAKANSTAMSSPRAHTNATATGNTNHIAQSSATVANGNHNAQHYQQHQQQTQYNSSYHQTDGAKSRKSEITAANQPTPSTIASSSSTMATVPAPTRQRLYSSYSIHSLLGGSSGSSSSSSSSSSPSSSASAKRPPNDQAIVSSANYTHHPQYTDPSYLRTMLASPKSPDSHHQHQHHQHHQQQQQQQQHQNAHNSTNNNPLNYGGKSPSSSASRKQRSPPYASPMHDSASRSPAASHADYGRGSPRATPPEGSYKMRHASEQLNNHNNQTQLAPQHAAFYSQYMMSPNATRSPNHHGHGHNAAGATTTPPSFNTSNISQLSSTTTQHIPNPTAPLYASAGSAVTGKATAGGSLSPPRSMTASPRDTTPRTVPKKTASIRRQFASPTASSTTSSSCPSPSAEQRSHHEEPTAAANAAHHQHDRKTPVAATSSAVLQRSSPLGPAVSPMLHHHYYMYPPVPNSATATHPHAAANNAAAAAAAAAAAYIPTVMPSVGGLPPAHTLHSAPPYYNPYISTIAALQRNQMWMQYPGGGVLPVLSPHHSAAASRLPPQFHGFPYNGSAAMAAAAAAAVAFGGGGGGGAPTPQQHAMLHHAQSAASMYGSGDRPRTPPPKLTDSTTDLSSKGAGGPTPATPRSMATESTPILNNNCIKDEQSSDVPLNLSKH